MLLDVIIALEGNFVRLAGDVKVIGINIKMEVILIITSTI